MNKKTLSLIIVLIAAIGAYLLLKKDNNSTIRKELTDFKVENTDKIDQIQITKKDEKGTIILKKEASNFWSLNDKWEAEVEHVNMVLNTLERMEVKSPVPNAQKEEIMNYLAVSGKKVELFSNGKAFKTIYFGTTTNDLLGTYAMLEGAKSPYIIHIPEFKGYINVHFSHRIKEWRTHMIYTIEEEEIKEVKVDWTNKPNESFTITNSGEEVTIIAKAGENNEASININKVRSYLNHFEKIPFTSFAQNVNQEEADSIEKTSPFCVISVTDKSGASRSVKIHSKPLEKNTYNKFDNEGNPLEVEVERYYAFVDENHEILVIQDATFRKIMKIYSDFLLD